MYDIISEKSWLLAAYRAKSPEISKWLRQSDLWHWLYSMQRIKGEPVSKRDIVDILAGRIVESAPVDAYSFAHNCVALRRDMESCIEMDSHVDVRMLQRWYATLFGREAVFRDTNPIIYEWEHIPPHFRDLPLETESLFKKAHNMRSDGTPTERAARLHLEFLRLYPFGEDTASMGFVLLMYSLMQEGLPLPMLTVDDREYNGLVAEYMAHQTDRPFIDMLERSLLNRLESALQICYQMPEKEEETEETEKTEE